MLYLEGRDQLWETFSLVTYFETIRIVVAMEVIKNQKSCKRKTTSKTLTKSKPRETWMISEGIKLITKPKPGET